MVLTAAQSLQGYLYEDPTPHGLRMLLTYFLSCIFPKDTWLFTPLTIE